jgi:geranylgeranyl pyrophosphate synthase
MPLLRCMRFPAVGKALEQVFCPRSNVSREQLRALVDQTDASTYTEMLAQRYVCLAKSRLESLDECPARNSLAWLADMAVRRES